MEEFFYEYLCGELITAMMPEEVKNVVQDGFEGEKRLEELGERIYELKNRISQRLGKEEDLEVEMLMEAMDEVNRIQCYQMYEYGMRISQRKQH